MNTVVTTPTQMKNAYTVDSNGVVRIFIHSKKHGDFVIMIDVDDLPEVSHHTWCIHKPGKYGKFYAMTRMYVGDKRKSVSLHQFLVGIKKGFHIDHSTGDSLDNRRHNLQVVTPRHNAHNRETTNGWHGVQSMPRSGYRASVVLGRKQYHLNALSFPEQVAFCFDLLLQFLGEVP